MNARELNLDQQAQLVKALGQAAALGHPVVRASVLETHISYVLLTGIHAYKIKKAVDLGFLNFTSVQMRRFFCEEELRLNRRSAPGLYLEVVPITGSIAHPFIGRDGPVLEYAVKMREFAQDALADSLLQNEGLTAHDIDDLAAHVAAFHQQADAASPASEFGTLNQVRAPMLQNFEQIRALSHPPQELDELAAWTQQQFMSHAELLGARKRQGFVRECHGDLHLGNIVRYEGQLVAFDCIEFNPTLRWIDVINDMAFLLMDLDYRGRSDLSARFLNRYLEIAGDYAGVPILSFYEVYRALVRAKVALIKSQQSALKLEDTSRFSRDFSAHIELAQRYTRPRKPALLITHGFSGSGKTTLSQGLLETIGAIRLRSDVERKRSQGLDPLARSHSAVEAGLYAKQATEDTYQRLREQAAMLLLAGCVVIVDATFLKRAQRDLFRALAQSLRVAFAIVDFTAPMEELRRRIAHRAHAAADASEADLAVLEHQLKSHEALAPEEAPEVWTFSEVRGAQLPYHAGWQPLLDRLGLPAPLPPMVQAQT